MIATRAQGDEKLQRAWDLSVERIVAIVLSDWLEDR